jgi:hypothetical protein
VSELLADTASGIQERPRGLGTKPGEYSWIEREAREVAAYEPHLPDAGVWEDFECFISLIGFPRILVR